MTLGSMQTFKAIVTALAGLSFLGFVLALFPVPAQGQPGGVRPATEVSVVNTPLHVTDAGQPFQKGFSFPEPLGGHKYQVPADKRLVIEWASMDIGMAPSCGVVFQIGTRAGGEGALHTIPTADIRTGATRRVEFAGQQVRIYADPGTEVVIQHPFSGSDCNFSGPTTISGVLFDVPASE